MYTQCPDCATAFSVTADVLRQASGKVRCGGCGNAFDALAYLSESKPTEMPTASSSGSVPELSPDTTDESSEAAASKAISAEQSAALLKTLDDLAGSDIRLEDTGIEWRLLPDDDSDKLDDDDSSGIFESTHTQLDAELSADAGDALVDELLDDRPTPVDELLTATPNKIEASEVFENTQSQPDNELRFDDDTGLPDDFEDQESAQPNDSVDFRETQSSVSVPELEANFAEPKEHTETQVDIVFGEPDEWVELLDEVDSDEGARSGGLSANDLSAAIIAPEPGDDRDEVTGLTFAEELAALPDDEDDVADAQEIEAADIPPDIDTQFDLQAEALGIDLSGMRKLSDHDVATDDAANDAMSDDTANVASDTANVTGQEPTEIYTPIDEDSSIDNDLYAAAFEAEQAVAAAAEASARNLALSLDENDRNEFDDERIGLQDEEELDLEALDDEQEDAADNVDDSVGDDDDVDIDDEQTEILPDSTGELEVELAKAQELSDELLDALETEESEPELLDADASESGQQVVLDELGIDDFDINDDLDELDRVEKSHEEAAPPEIIVPPESEEEQTINRMIDQDLLRLAIEDDEGVASTMVLQGKGASDANESTDGKAEHASGFDAFSADAEDTGVETIIMEGEFVRTALEQEALDASAANDEADRIDDGEDDDEDAEAVDSFLASAKKTFRGKLTAADGTSRAPNIGMISGLVVLGLLLAGQLVHQSRAELATIPAVNKVIAPVYRAVGAPITPEWDVTGWRFEVTRGSTSGGVVDESMDVSGSLADLTGTEIVDEADADEADADPIDGENAVETDTSDSPPTPEVLTIYSRLGNKSKRPLPYPLISVSLTDRFEETIGSKVLEPRQYLSADFDLEQMVSPGTTFNAAIAIATPSADATGFKLNVCYRQVGGELRCAIEDFK